VDEDFILTTEYIKKPLGARGGDWTARIKGKLRFDEVRYLTEEDETRRDKVQPPRIINYF